MAVPLVAVTAPAATASQITATGALNRLIVRAEATTSPSVGSGCRLTGGASRSQYDNETTTNPSTFDIDHVVPLKEAWDSGASAWSDTQREQFANDLGVSYALIVVTASSNGSESAGDPAERMPTASSFGCTYATDWVLTKYRWGLSIDTAEKSALSSYLSGSCGAKSVVLPTVKAASVATTSKKKPITGPSLSFKDIGKGSQFPTEILWLADSCISTGYSDGKFRPYDPITRDAMAAFMYRFDKDIGVKVLKVPKSPTPPKAPSYPGNSKNCADFDFQSEAQAWYELYFPRYGDVARFDGDNDGAVCVSLP